MPPTDEGACDCSTKREHRLEARQERVPIHLPFHRTCGRLARSQVPRTHCTGLHRVESRRRLSCAPAWRELPARLTASRTALPSGKHQVSAGVPHSSPGARHAALAAASKLGNSGTLPATYQVAAGCAPVESFGMARPKSHVPTSAAPRDLTLARAASNGRAPAALAGPRYCQYDPGSDFRGPQRTYRVRVCPGSK